MRARSDESRESGLGTALQRAGVELREGTNETRDPALVLIDAVNNDSLAAVRGCTPASVILAVSLVPLRAMELFRLLDAGAHDVVLGSDLAQLAEQVAARLRRMAAVRALMDSEPVHKHAVGSGASWRALVRAVVEVAAFTRASVLVTGETGTGKEQVARLVHALDPRPNKRELVVVDCTTLTPELAGSELFGHERGAFTGAATARDGACALAHEGTLFLDEVGELPLVLQAQLLRVVQEQQYKRVGSNTWQRAEFRLISATNRDLEQEVRAGRFRSDLYFRIAGFTCKTPPLRERREDILPLVSHFMQQLAPDLKGELDPGVREYLLTRDYPGNVRDLRQTISRICYRHTGPGPLTVGDIPPAERGACNPEREAWPDAAFQGAVQQAVDLGIGLKEISQTAADLAVQIALTEEGGSLPRAANRLGVTPRALQLRAVGRRGDALPE